MPPFISGLINGRNQISRSVTWGTSDLRKWLNGVFFRAHSQRTNRSSCGSPAFLMITAPSSGSLNRNILAPDSGTGRRQSGLCRQRRRHRHSGRKSGQAGFYGAARYPDSIPEKVRNRAGQVTARAAIYSQRRIHNTYLLTERLWQGR